MSSSSSISAPNAVAKKPLSTFGGFVAGGIAACGAVTVSNPIEVVKTRMQLQGELAARSETKRIYTGLFQALGTIAKHEGIVACQRGLMSAYFYQVSLNGCRLGFYEPVRVALTRAVKGDDFDYHIATSSPVYINALAGCASGVMGAIIGSPFYLIKTKQQSYSPVFKVGDQTHYRNFVHGIRTIYGTEGFRGLYRGLDAAIIRTGAGSSVQLPIYNAAKYAIDKYNIVNDGPLRHLLASSLSGMGVGVVMNPFDVISTRMYNQKGDGVKYKNALDCMIKTVTIEGPLALYKGFLPQLLRICPHTILCLMFLEQTSKLMKKIEGIPL
ncbi:mitochondrial carrier [Nadsonia fulvescens var. elongata DSM 6958]|uniref:Mitochondrial carrier n=1 Tax=Nadsonia fulvescens var. elongata DSM 6958 TaxID=857566 RepID=A0A1E3PIH1_9ASCO|nr:mitochondrial carrier [Nadsonia fulvescens var. elongata DSM 6958]